VRRFLRFLQRSVEMGKTSAGMCIERIAPDGHNVQHQVALCATTFFHPLKGKSNEQL
jgi:NADP-dependent alcohol dehydrogenase